MQSIAEKIIDFEIPGLAVGTMSKGTLISPQVGLPLVVMVHGTGNDKNYPWANVVECFVASGFQVAVFDLPGHGKESSDVLAESSSASLEKLLVVLGGLTVWTKLYGLGQSLGGALLLEAASRKDLGFRKLSVWGLPSDREPDFRVLTELLSPLFISTWSLPTYYGLWGSLPALFQFKRRDFPIRTSHESYIEHVLDIIKNSREKILASGCVPTQFIHGNFDFIGDLDFAETLSRQIDNSHVHRILETHFSLLCSEKAADLAIDWFLQH
jgi:pimeloyl-ACP methyl ester carboxylesterase